MMRCSQLVRFLTLAVLCALLALPAGAQTKMENITVAQSLQTLLYLPLYIAIDKGFMAKHGLNVSKLTAGGSANSVATVISKSATFSVQDPMTAVLAAQRGVGIKLVSSVVDGVPVWLVVKKDSPIKTIADLAGKQIVTGTPPSTSTYLLQDLLARKGIKANLTYVTSNTVIGPMLAGQDDAAALYEPDVEQAVAQCCRVLYEFSAPVMGGYAFSSLDVLQETIAKRPDLVRNFVAAMQDAIHYLHADVAGANDVALQEFPTLPADEVRAAVKRLMRENVYPASALITQTSYENAQKLPLALGTIKTAMPYADIVDVSFAHETAPK